MPAFFLVRELAALRERGNEIIEPRFAYYEVWNLAVAYGVHC